MEGQSDRALVLAAATKLAGGDRERALHWYHSVPLPEYDNRTAEELVLMGHAATVMKHITQLSSGSSG